MTNVRRIVRILYPADRVATPYLDVPFEVSDPTSSLEVRLEYDRSKGVIDLGCDGPAEWRGWSGGTKTGFVITETEATCGYIPGTPELGEWSVVLGLHKIPAEGLEFHLLISTPAEHRVEPVPPAPPVSAVERPSLKRRPFAAADGLPWFAGDFHAHTLHSDGALSIRALAAEAVSNGLDFLAVTDHNTVSHHRHLPGVSAEYGIALLPGQEVTTARGHANAFGSLPWIDFRRHPQTWVDSVEPAGGVLSINHPVSRDCSWQWSLDRKPGHAEIMHSSWQSSATDTGIWAWWNAWGTASAIPLGGSDFHRPGEGVSVGTPTTWVAAEEASPESILEGVKRGRTSLSMGGARNGAVLLHVGDELIAYDAEGAVFGDITGRRCIITSPRQTLKADGNGPYRLETADRSILAITA
ncbi:CehA/McbA family metallohydrolase [Paenarthrobacter sp. Z7-10]|uniref:CehA/McbA family metallohydrolase n=1 Tax=Paenarthrobacter sp. Z7-10 TaxID=2787635 RepID=UPI0022A949CE|nr:CehA/McbA family metallohydrolase [Paenarthrobacter sp. Z7-10]MCZ2404640.1 CehA/McbA family metallohydrolase [Paenarthrobacter sp. Z7-10]